MKQNWSESLSTSIPQADTVIAAQNMAAAKRRTLLVLLLILAGMISLVAASPTLYELFCRVTGYGGTAANSLEVYERPLATITGLPAHEQAYQVQVEARVSGDAPIRFETSQRRIEGFHIGQRILLDFSVENTSDEPILAQALHQICLLYTSPSPRDA